MTFETERERERKRESWVLVRRIMCLAHACPGDTCFEHQYIAVTKTHTNEKKGGERGIRRRLNSLKRNSSTSLAWVSPRSPPPRVFHPLTQAEKWCRGSQRFIFFYWQLITLHNLDLMYLKPIIHPQPLLEKFLAPIAFSFFFLVDRFPKTSQITSKELYKILFLLSN